MGVLPKTILTLVLCNVKLEESTFFWRMTFDKKNLGFDKKNINVHCTENSGGAESMNYRLNSV
jgi:hypothetical protein